MPEVSGSDLIFIDNQMFGVSRVPLSEPPLTLVCITTLAFQEATDQPSRPTFAEGYSGCMSWLLPRLTLSAYSCDRDLGMALGRPPAIQDEWITADVSSN